MAQANNPATSLELLSARVCVRKTLTLRAGGDTSLRKMKPVAMEFARTSTMFQGLERELFNDINRWSPPKPVPITPNQPSLYDPSLAFTTQQKWAIKWNSDLMKSLHQLDDSDSDTIESVSGETGQIAFMLGFCFEFTTHVQLCLVGEMSTRTCHAMWLDHVARNGAGNEAWMIPTTLSFLASVDCIASLYDDAMYAAATKQYIKMSVVKLKMCPVNESSIDGRFRLQYYITDQQSCCTLKIRKRKPTTRTSSNAGNETGDERTINHDSDIGDDDEDDDNVVGDHDADDESLLRLTAEELLGESEAWLEEFQQSLDADIQFQDIASMEQLHTKLVAAAVDKNQEDDGKSKSTNDFDSLSVDEPEHTYEDGMGESVFQRYLNNSLKRNGVGDQHEDDQGETVVQLTQSQVDAAFYIWSRNITQSMDALYQMVLDLRRFDVHMFDSSIGNDISLLVHASGGESIEVVYVSWLKPHKKLEGRCISLDDDNCVVYPSHFTNHKVKFINPIIVLSQSKVRVRKQSRESMPIEIRRLYSMFNAALDVSTELDLDDSSVDIGETRRQCIGCHSNESGGVLRRCALCLQCWHDDCADQCASHTHGFIQSHEVATLADKDIDISELPFLFLLGYPERTSQSDIRHSIICVIRYDSTTCPSPCPYYIHMDVPWPMTIDHENCFALS